MKSIFRFIALCGLTAISGENPAQSLKVNPPLIGNDSQIAQELALSGQATQGGYLIGKARKNTRQLLLNGKVIPLAPDGQFFMAFDRDAPAVSQISITYIDGTNKSGKLTIAPRNWQIEHIDAARKPEGITDPEYLKLRNQELAQINSARAIGSQSNGWKQAFMWPLQGRLSGHFGAQRIYRGVAGAYHSGTDIAGPTGAAIVAPADGVVVLAAEKPLSLEGNLLIIDHGMGLSSAMLHCSSLAVKLGDVVRQGQLVARVGMTGRATGPHLHWSLRWLEARLDAELLAPSMPMTAKVREINAASKP